MLLVLSDVFLLDHAGKRRTESRNGSHWVGTLNCQVKVQALL